MTTDDDLLPTPRPGDDPILYLCQLSLYPGDDPLPKFPTLSLKVVRPTHGAPKAEELQVPPDIPHRKAVHQLKLVTCEISLMSVNHKDALPGFGLVQDQAFVNLDPIFLNLATPTVLNIVVASDDAEPILSIKSVHQVKDSPMGTPNVAEPPGLPQFVAISDLNIGKPPTVVMIQRSEEKFFIPGKGIRPTIVPSVKVAKENDAGRIIKRDLLGCLKDLSQPPVCELTPPLLSSLGILSWYCPQDDFLTYSGHLYSRFLPERAPQ
jgi:hypothetical protein